MKREIFTAIIFTALTVSAPRTFARDTNSADIVLPEGFQASVYLKGLGAPMGITFDDRGRLIIAESGYGKSGTPQISRIETNGKKTILASGLEFGGEVPVTAVAWYENFIYVVHGGTVSTIGNNNQIHDIITGLPSQGDYGANQIAFSRGNMYLAIGTATNSGVVGEDNTAFGWINNPTLKNMHDVPCFDSMLDNQTFESKNLFGTNPAAVRTSPYSSFGTALPAFATIKGNIKCNGAILRAKPDGRDLQVYAWGFRNPVGLRVGTDGNLYTTMQGFNPRGSRPIANSSDCFYRVQPGDWYGWPDFACDLPVTNPQFKPANGPQPASVLASHPTQTTPKPVAKFDTRSFVSGFSFAPTAEWGKPTEAFITLFGNFIPATGMITEPIGSKILKVDTATGVISDYIGNARAGEASRNGLGGLEHPIDLVFGPDGAMYIVDFGIMAVNAYGWKVEPSSGVIWRIAPKGASVQAAGKSFFNNTADWYAPVGFLSALALFLGFINLRESRRALQRISPFLNRTLVVELARRRRRTKE